MQGELLTCDTEPLNVRNRILRFQQPFDTLLLRLTHLYSGQTAQLLQVYAKAKEDCFVDTK